MNCCYYNSAVEITKLQICSLRQLLISQSRQVLQTPEKPFLLHFRHNLKHQKIVGLFIDEICLQKLVVLPGILLKKTIFTTFSTQSQTSKDCWAFYRRDLPGKAGSSAGRPS